MLRPKFWSDVIVFGIILFFCSSCENKSAPITTAPHIEIKDSVVTPTREELRWNRILRNVGEPDLTEFDKEAYRFSYGGFLGHDIFMFTIIVDSISILSSKFILDSAYIYKPDRQSEAVRLLKDSSIRSFKQILTAEQINHIRSLLEGTYYHAIGRICPDGDGYMHDDMGYLFEFNTVRCWPESLKYHQIRFMLLEKGRFTEIWNYIIGISNLTASDKRLQQGLMEE